MESNLENIVDDDDSSNFSQNLNRGTIISNNWNTSKDSPYRSLLTAYKEN